MARWTLGAVALGSLLFGLFAGCSGKATSAGSETGFLETQPTLAGKGAISGVVVDDAIRPIAGANVTLGANLKTVRSDASGRFAFDDVDPGFTVLRANAAGFFAVQATADVKAGETSKVRVQLLADRSPQPYHITTKFHGFVQLWAGIAQFFVEDAYSVFVDPKGTPFCDCNYYFTADQNLTGMVFEAVWTDSIAHPGGQGDNEFYALVGQADSNMFESNYCASPCRYDVALTDYKQGAQTKALLQGPDEYVTFQQEYDMFITLFYRQAQPKDWSFVKGDA